MYWCVAYVLQFTDSLVILLSLTEQDLDVCIRLPERAKPCIYPGGSNSSNANNIIHPRLVGQRVAFLFGISGLRGSRL